jgi:hypothetical protein
VHTPGAARLAASLCAATGTQVGSADVNVIAATLVAIAVPSKVTLKVDQVTSLAAVATYNDGSSSDFTPACGWLPRDWPIAVPWNGSTIPKSNGILAVGVGTTRGSLRLRCGRQRYDRERRAISRHFHCESTNLNPDAS